MKAAKNAKINYSTAKGLMSLYEKEISNNNPIINSS